MYFREKIKDFTTAYNCIYIKRTGEIIVANCNYRKGILCERPLGEFNWSFLFFFVLIFY